MRHTPNFHPENGVKILLLLLNPKTKEQVLVQGSYSKLAKKFIYLNVYVHLKEVIFWYDMPTVEQMNILDRVSNGCAVVKPCIKVPRKYIPAYERDIANDETVRITNNES